jgi:azurin
MKSIQILVLLTLSLGTVLFSACDSTTEIELGTVGDTMAYDKTSFDVKAGSTVKLTLKNNGTSAAMQHDFVLVKPGTEQEVDNQSMAAGPAKDYLADSNPNILAHTKLLKPGESDSITFKAPSTAGDYPFLCTYPGHYPLMKGVLHVQ